MPQILSTIRTRSPRIEQAVTKSGALKFIKAEGWEDWTTPGSDPCFLDPISKEFTRYLSTAYRLAKGRKEYKDRKALLANGFDTIFTANGYRWTYRGADGYWLIVTKSEALIILNGGGPDANP